ncbi:MAG: 4Fe-4S binding protein [Sphaerochaetaceae bacterium]|nr:4Fe-4S binding protein [Sphaerochaetaceae bacterium]
MKEIQQELKVCGAPSLDELHASPCYQLPPQDRRALAAVIECVEGIPCNPCETSCPQNAITVGEEITALPVVNLEACTGCGICVAACPGLAIYLKKYLFKDDRAYIAFPFEYLPLPKEGETVTMVNRLGESVCEGTVLRVVKIKKMDRTAVIHCSYPNRFYEEVVSIRRLSL